MRIHRINLPAARIASPFYGVKDPDWMGQHDYDPAGEHEEDRRRTMMQRTFVACAKEIARDHMEEFRETFKRFKVFFTRHEGEGVATYISGTYSEPVILVDLDKHEEAYQGEEGWVARRTYAMRSLMHELWHAVQDQDATMEDVGDDDLRQKQEDEAEVFCRRFSSSHVPILRAAQDEDPVAMVSSKIPIRLTEQQAQAIRDEIAKSGTARPNPAEYWRAGKRLEAIPIPRPVDRKKGPANIGNTTRGYEGGDIYLLPGFNPAVDLPEGWGIYSMYDSGGNYRIDNAAKIAWTNIWNYWPNYVKGGTHGTKMVTDDLGDSRWTWEEE